MLTVVEESINPHIVVVARTGTCQQTIACGVLSHRLPVAKLKEAVATGRYIKMCGIGRVDSHAHRILFHWSIDSLPMSLAVHLLPLCGAIHLSSVVPTATYSIQTSVDEPQTVELVVVRSTGIYLADDGYIGIVVTPVSIVNGFREMACRVPVGRIDEVVGHPPNHHA